MKEVIDENHREYPVATWGADYRNKPAYWEWFYKRKKTDHDREAEPAQQSPHASRRKTGW